jgi:hypothetical protein
MFVLVHFSLHTHKGYSKDQLAASMQRLLDAGRITVLTEGSPSQQCSRLVETGQPTVH